LVLGSRLVAHSGNGKMSLRFFDFVVLILTIHLA